MPLDSSATPTTATNSATYLANNRLRGFVPDGWACGGAATAGGAANVRPSGVSGWREILIRAKLARTWELVSCRSATAHIRLWAPVKDAPIRRARQLFVYSGRLEGLPTTEIEIRDLLGPRGAGLS